MTIWNFTFIFYLLYGDKNQIYFLLLYLALPDIQEVLSIN